MKIGTVITRTGLFSLLLALSLAFSGTAIAANHRNDSRNSPSPAPVKPVEEFVCGKKVVDRYRYMENTGDPEVMAWFKEQSEYSRSVLNRIPGRKELINKMQEFDSRKPVRAYNLHITDNDRYFYLKRTPSDETGKLYFRDGFHGNETLLFDPSGYAKNNGDYYTVGTIAPSDDGSKIAFSIFPNGSENAVLLIMDVNKKTFFPEKIDRCRFASPSWLPDNSAFLYNRLHPAVPGANPQHDSATRLHYPGTDPSADKVIFSRTLNPELAIRPEDIPRVAIHKESGRLFGFVSSVDRRLTVYYAPASEHKKKKITWEKLFEPKDEIHDFELTDKDIYILTPKNAPGFRLLKTPLQNPDPAHAEVVVPEFPGKTLSGFVLTKDGLYYTLSRNGVRRELFFQEYGSRSPSKITLPFEAGTIVLSSKGFIFSDVWVLLAGWNSDYQRYRFDKQKGIFSKETLSSPAEYPEYKDLVVEEITVPSHDGVRIPLSLIYRKGLEKNGENPVLMYGYGAYGKSLTPFFSPSLLLWTWKGGILAILHVRGGGELGDTWHSAGMKATKPNTWKDTIASAEYLVRKGYTSPRKIVLNGGSAGGILVGRAIIERPELFAAAIPQVGAMNPLRGEETPNGPVNVPEFGTVSIPEECRALLAMDPYLNLRDGVNYPAALVTAGLNDPRVAAWQPAKFAARMQAATASHRPVLFFSNFKAGHGIGSTKTIAFETLADVLSFGLWQTGHPEFRIR